jgi:hypothetical protein
VEVRRSNQGEHGVSDALRPLVQFFLGHKILEYFWNKEGPANFSYTASVLAAAQSERPVLELRTFSITAVPAPRDQLRQISRKVGPESNAATRRST